MARTSRNEISEDVVWLAVQALAVILVFFVGPLLYRNRRKIARRIRHTITSVRHRLKKRSILRLLKQRSRDELLEITFCLVAWKEGSFADEDLLFPRPPHYATASGTGLHNQNESHGDFGKSLLFALTRKTRDEIRRSIGHALDKRSLYTLNWLSRCLENPHLKNQAKGYSGEGTRPDEQVIQETLVLDAPLEALDAARTAEEIKAIRDKAGTMEAWCQEAGLSFAIQNEYAEIGVRAERKIGLLFLARNHAVGTWTDGVRPVLGSQDDWFRQLLALRISRRDVALWQRLAEIPEPALQDYVRLVRNAGTALTRDGLLGFALDLKREQRTSAMVKPVEIASAAVFADSAPQRPKLASEIVLRGGDFREALRDIPAGTIGAIVTHAPLGGNSSAVWYDLSSFARRVLKPGRLLIAAVSPAHLPHAVQALSAYLTYVWLGALVFNTEATIAAPDHIRCFHSPVLFFSNGAFETSSWMSDTIWTDSELQRGRGPARQRLGVGAFIESATLPGETVCDPFVGEGLVAIASQSMGRRFIGCDANQLTIEEIRRHISEELPA